jgi:hypothetical protein
MASELLKNRALMQRLKEPDVPQVDFGLQSTGFEELFTLPEPKPQELLDIQEDNRKGRLLDSLNRIGGGLMDESVDFIKRQELGFGGNIKKTNLPTGVYFQNGAYVTRFRRGGKNVQESFGPSNYKSADEALKAATERAQSLGEDIKDLRFKENILGPKIIEDYKKVIQDQFDKGNLNNAPTMDKYVKENLKKYKTKYSNAKKLIDKVKNFSAPEFLENKKIDLLQKLVTESNLGLKHTGQKEISRKIIKSDKFASETSSLNKRANEIIKTLDTPEEKALKVFDLIIEQDLPIKDYRTEKGAKSGRGIVVEMVSELSDTSTDLANKGIKSSKYYTKDFEKAFKYLNMIARQTQDFDGIKFNEAINFANERLKGAGTLTGKQPLSFYKDGSTNIKNYAWRHWTRTNFNNLPSRVKLYDKKKLTREGDSIVPKKGILLEKAEIKWKPGININFKDMVFSYDDSELFDNTTIKTKGRASGLFDEVYKITNDYQNLFRKKVPDPKKTWINNIVWRIYAALTRSLQLELASRSL